MPFKNQPKNSISSYHILPILLPVNVDRKKVISTLKRKEYNQAFITHHFGVLVHMKMIIIPAIFQMFSKLLNVS